MSLRNYGVSLLIFSLLDIVVSSCVFAHASTQTFIYMLNQFYWYSFLTNLCDFWFLSLLRCCIFSGIGIGITWRPYIAKHRIFVASKCIAVFNTFGSLFTLVKLLVVTETDPTLLQDVCFWILVVWSLLAFFFTAVLVIIASSKISKDLKEERSSVDGETSSTDNLLQEEKEDEPNSGTTKSSIVELLKFSKPDAHLLLIAFLALLVAAVADVLSPQFVGNVISGIVISKSNSEFMRAIIFFAAISVVSLIATGIRGGIFTAVLGRMTLRLRYQLFKSILEQEVGFFDKTRTGDIMSRLSADVATMTDTLSLNVNVFLRNFVKAAGIAFMMFRLSWRLSLITIAGLPLIAITEQYFGGFYDRLSSAIQDSISKTSQVAEEVISNFRTVLSLAGEKDELERYKKDLKTVYKYELKLAGIYASSIWAGTGLSLILTLATLYYGGHLVIVDLLDSKNLVSFLIYQINLGDCLQSMGNVYTGLMQAVGASRKVIQYLHREPKQRRSGPLLPPGISGKIEFKNVDFYYPTRKNAPVLKNISFTVEPGQIVALVGKSGSGKSSCLALLQRFYEPESGQILLDGIPVGEYDHSFLHNIMAMVSQEPVLFARSIKDNIKYALNTSDEEVAKAAKMADAEVFIGDLPKTFDTECGEKGIQMSGGQKQRIAIARALIRRPNILLLDEATSALDATAEAAVQATLSKAMAGRTVLVVAHRLSTIKNADLILVVNNGVIVEKGNHNELLAKKGHYAELVKRQLTGTADIDDVATALKNVERGTDIGKIPDHLDDSKKVNKFSLSTSPTSHIFRGSVENTNENINV